MQISALKEISTDENRVALTPDAIKLFQRLGLDVLIERMVLVIIQATQTSFMKKMVQKLYLEMNV